MVTGLASDPPAAVLAAPPRANVTVATNAPAALDKPTPMIARLTGAASTPIALAAPAPAKVNATLLANAPAAPVANAPGSKKLIPAGVDIRPALLTVDKVSLALAGMGSRDRHRRAFLGSCFT